MPNDTASFDMPTGWRKVGRYTFLVAVALIVLLPVYVTVVGAFKPADRVLTDQLVPNAVTLDAFRDAWRLGNLDRYLVNSAVVAGVVTIAQVVTSVLSGYAFSLLRFPGRDAAFIGFLATLLVPFEATVLVNFQTIDSLGWVDSYTALIVPFTATAFGTFLVRQTFMTLPRDLKDAAEIDGVGHLGFLWNVAIPLVRPTVGALALFSFLSTWNQYLWPTLITRDQSMRTVQTGLRYLNDSALDAPNMVMAGTVIAAIPIVVVLIVFQRQLVRGLTAGAVKG
ncbi:MAG: carbohydrate ABC transporter permease [Desertimonas sp.]